MSLCKICQKICIKSDIIAFLLKILNLFFKLKPYFIFIYLKAHVIIERSDFVNKILVFWVLSTMTSTVRTAVSLWSSMKCENVVRGLVL